MLYKIKDFFIKKRREAVFALSLLSRGFIAFIFITLVPVVIFMFFIRYEPKEIEFINSYVNSEIEKISDKKISYASIKITSESLIKINFILKDLKIIDKTFAVELPTAIAKINIVNLLFKKYILESLEIIKLESSLKLEENKIAEEKDEIYSLANVVQTIDRLFRNLNNKISIRRIFINNSTFNLIEKTGKKNQFFAKNIAFFLKKKREILKIRTFARTKLENSDIFVESNSNCEYNVRNYDLSCVLDVNNVSLSTLYGILFKNFKDVSRFTNSINGVFNFKAVVDIEKSYTLKKLDYTLQSESASFQIKELFNRKIFLKNFIVNGNIEENGDKIEIKNFSTNFFIDSQNDIIKFDSNLIFERNKSITFSLFLNESDVRNADSLWPVFLDKNGVKSWVVEHLKSGKAKDIKLDMSLVYDENVKEYSLNILNSSFNLDNVNLDYYESLPKIEDIKAVANFTKDDMTIEIISARSENSILSNGKVYIDFDKPFVIIDFNSRGKLFELGYYIDYSNKEKVKNIIEGVLDADAVSKINVIVPLEGYDKKDYNILDDFYIKLQSSLTLKDNFIFSDKSNATLNLEKKKGSSIFKANFDLKNSTIKFECIDFAKRKQLPMNIKSNIIVDKNVVILDNLRVENTNLLSFKGNGIISNGYLKSLNLDNLRFKNTNGKISITANENEMLVDIKTDILSVRWKETNVGGEKNEVKFDNLTSYNMEILVNSDEFMLNNKYVFDNFKGEIFYKNNRLDYMIFDMADNKANKIKINVNNLWNKNKRYLNFTFEMDNLGDFLSSNEITTNLDGGYLFVEGDMQNNVVDLRLKITNNFEINYNNDNNRIITEIKTNELTPQKIKKTLAKKDVLKYKKMTADATISGNNFNIKRFLLESREVFSGINISGFGVVDYKKGEINMEGLIIPFQKFNTLFGANKIPVLNKILFGGKDGGLFTVGYNFTKKNYEGEYNFKIVPISSINANSVKNLMLLLLLL